MNKTMWLVLVVAIIAITILGAMIHITLFVGTKFKELL